MIEREFLAAIAADPADDGLKLVYADWLDDRGDRRGQIIRLSVELRRLTHMYQPGLHVSADWEELLLIQVERESSPLRGKPRPF